MNKLTSEDYVQEEHFTNCPVKSGSCLSSSRYQGDVCKQLKGLLQSFPDALRLAGAHQFIGAAECVTWFWWTLLRGPVQVLDGGQAGTIDPFHRPDCLLWSVPTLFSINFSDTKVVLMWIYSDISLFSSFSSCTVFGLIELSCLLLLLLFQAPTDTQTETKTDQLQYDIEIHQFNPNPNPLTELWLCFVLFFWSSRCFAFVPL